MSERWVNRYLSLEHDPCLGSFLYGTEAEARQAAADWPARYHRYLGPTRIEFPNA